MSYIEDNLQPNEKIEFVGKIHNFYKFVGYLVILTGLIFTISGGDVDDSTNTFFTVVGIVITIMGTFTTLDLHTREIAITNNRLIYKTGIIARNVFELQLKKVESVSLDQSIFERIIGSGVIKISGTGGGNRPIDKLVSPAQLRDYLYTILEDE